MLDYLGKTITLPLEREYEAWVAHQIGAYFTTLGVSVDVFAVSPSDEDAWPADEAVSHGEKLVGLQVKRPHVSRASRPNHFERLQWSLSAPPLQLETVLAHPEIFYCLPTFLNRDVQKEALHHCLFWRPEDASHGSPWYGNPDRRVKINDLCNATRWGLFAERFLRCQIGHPLDGASFSGYMRSLRAEIEERNTRAILIMLVLRERYRNLTAGSS